MRVFTCKINKLLILTLVRFKANIYYTRSIIVNRYQINVHEIDRFVIIIRSLA